VRHHAAEGEADVGTESLGCGDRAGSSGLRGAARCSCASAAEVSDGRQAGGRLPSPAERQPPPENSPSARRPKGPAGVRASPRYHPTIDRPWASGRPEAADRGARAESAGRRPRRPRRGRAPPPRRAVSGQPTAEG
jgi:hypothetical protein